MDNKKKKKANLKRRTHALSVLKDGIKKGWMPTFFKRTREIGIDVIE